MKAVVWNMYGDILKKFDSIEDAEEWIEDCGYTVVYTHPGDRELNLQVNTDF